MLSSRKNTVFAPILFKRMDSPRSVMLEMMLNSSSGTTSAVIALDQMEPTAPT